MTVVRRRPHRAGVAGDDMLRVRGLRLGYGSVAPVLEDLDLAVATGEFASLVGPSGSGKSSLLRAVAALHAPASGDIELDVGSEDVGFLFQDDALLPWRSARDNVALPLRIRGLGRDQARARADAWLGHMGLTGLESRYPAELSGGQRKRVALAQVLITRPRLLLMDEPFASLDAIVRRRVSEDLLAWVESEVITVLLVTHDLEEAITFSDRVHLLSGGPRAQVVERYEVPLARPRDPVAVRRDPAFGQLLERLWDDLAAVIDDAGDRGVPHAPAGAGHAVGGGAR